MLDSTTWLVPAGIFGTICFAVWTVLTILADRCSGTEDRLDRLSRSGCRPPGDDGDAPAIRKVSKVKEVLAKAAPTFGKALMPKTELEESQLRVRLTQAGWRSADAVVVFLGCKCILAGLLGVGALLVMLSRYGPAMNTWLVGGLLAGVGFYLPELAVRWVRRRRQTEIFCGLPNALDLMVVCVEAGLGLDAAMRRVCDEMQEVCREISDEFRLANFELQMGRPRRDVLHNLGVRTGVDDVRSLAAILIQADRFGSSIAQALRVQSDSMRSRRRLMAEERAAKTAVKLIFPLVLFIFPGIFVILVGPAAIQIARGLLPSIKMGAI